MEFLPSFPFLNSAGLAACMPNLGCWGRTLVAHPRRFGNVNLSLQMEGRILQK
jgi:hypothetical protein